MYGFSYLLRLKSSWICWDRSRNYASICLEKIWRTAIIFFQDRRFFPVLDSNWEPPYRTFTASLLHQPTLLICCHNPHNAAHTNSTKQEHKPLFHKVETLYSCPRRCRLNDSLEFRCIVVQGVQLPWQHERLTARLCHVRHYISTDKRESVVCSPIQSWLNAPHRIRAKPQKQRLKDKHYLQQTVLSNTKIQGVA